MGRLLVEDSAESAVWGVAGAGEEARSGPEAGPGC